MPSDPPTSDNSQTVGWLAMGSGIAVMACAALLFFAAKRRQNMREKSFAQNPLFKQGSEVVRMSRLYEMNTTTNVPPATPPQPTTQEVATPPIAFNV